MDILAIRNSADFIAAGAAAIHEAVLRQSPRITRPNFDTIDAGDLALLFAQYDQQFFGDWLGQAVALKTQAPLGFRLSTTMTRAGGKTITYRGVAGDGTRYKRFEIAIASRLLFMSFGDIQRPVIVCGLACKDRLQALQRIIEHEIIHLAELAAFGRTTCKRPRFKALARRIFGHSQFTHDLVTPREHAAVQHGLGVGSQVEFEFQSQRLVGRVNRIHRRATVLVEAANGLKYSDGGPYHRFYIPLAKLRPLA